MSQANRKNQKLVNIQNLPYSTPEGMIDLDPNHMVSPQGPPLPPPSHHHCAALCSRERIA